MFRELDIRGKYGAEVTPENFMRLGSAAAEMFEGLVVGMDYRPHNEKLLQAFLAGYRRKETFIGFAPSPAIAFLAKSSGMSLTASHNPRGYNGAKFFAKNTYADESQMAQLKRKYDSIAMQQSQLLPLPQARTEGMLEYEESIPEIEGGVFDLGGGAVCALAHLFPRHINGTPDPLFERRDPEPKDSTLGRLKEITAKEKALGFAFDGDGDRVMLCDCGTVMEGDVTAAYAAQSLLSKGDGVVLSIDCRQEVFEAIEDDGFCVHTSKVGDANVLRMALDKRAAFSAERSGHYALPAHAPNSDGIYFSALLSQTRPGELAQYAARFRNTTLKKEVFCRADFGKIRELAERHAPASVVTIDGVKAVFEDFTILLRASTTETKVRINSEAATPQKAKEGMALAEEMLSKARVK
ncbi:MAG: hypothetical protein V1708_03200 [Candidatus Micrarchaeota archaeon]